MRRPRIPTLAPALALTAMALLAGPATPRAAEEADVRAVGERLVCYCGCSGQTVAACTCGTADAIRERIAGQLDSGLDVDAVVAAWVAERGEQILAVPTREGFNLVGWVMPFVVTLLGLVFVTVVVLRWQRRPAPDPLPGADDALSESEQGYLSRVERELKSLRR